MPGVAKAFELLGARVKQVHLHDNGGEKDEHCWPGEGTIDWTAVRTGIAALKQPPVGTLEIRYEPEMEARQMSESAAKAFTMLEQPVTAPQT